MSDSQTLQWQALSRDHHLPPFTDFKALNAKGTRNELIERLTYWHRCSRNAGYGSCGNFACVGVNVFSPTQPEKCNVSPRLLTPLRANKSKSRGQTPKSILKSGKKSARKSVSKLMFSPYNEVRVIPDRFSAKAEWENTQ